MRPRRQLGRKQERQREMRSMLPRQDKEADEDLRELRVAGVLQMQVVHVGGGVARCMYVCMYLKIHWREIRPGELSMCSELCGVARLGL